MGEDQVEVGQKALGVGSQLVKKQGKISRGLSYKWMKRKIESTFQLAQEEGYRLIEGEMRLLIDSGRYQTVLRRNVKFGPKGATHVMNQPRGVDFEPRLKALLNRLGSGSGDES